jgi:hypothetical protein
VPSTRPIYSTGSAWTLLQAGCPIRRSPDQRLLAATRGLSQQRYVLHRPLVPRHPPCALSSLTFLSSLDDEDRCVAPPSAGGRQNTRDIARLVKMRHHARLVWRTPPWEGGGCAVRPNMDPRRLIRDGKDRGKAPPVGRRGISVGRHPASRAAVRPRRLRRRPQDLRGKSCFLVEMAGLEPATPCLQSRCSPS